MDAGFTNAVFQTLEYTNVGGLALPTRATLVTFAPQLGDPAPRVLRRFSYEIIATNLTAQLLHTGGFKPQLPGVIYVNDMRFSTPANDLHVNYYVSDGQWLTDDQVKRLPEFAVAVAHAGQTGTPLQPIRRQGGQADRVGAPRSACRAAGRPLLQGKAQARPVGAFLDSLNFRTCCSQVKFCGPGLWSAICHLLSAIGDWLFRLRATR